MVGFNIDYQPTAVYGLISDNIRLNEIKNDPKDAKRYGVEHLF